MQKILTDGRVAVIVRGDGAWIVTIDGAPYTTGTLRELPAPQGPVTHVIGVGKVIGFTAAEAAELQAVLDAERAAYLATPAGRYATLKTDVEMAYGTWGAAREHAADTGDWSRVGPATKALDAADAALDAFNAAHPEFLAAEVERREAREEEAVRRAFLD